MPTDNFSTLPFSQCISKISIKHKIKQKDYLASGKYPVIDQGQSFISGYCDDEIAIKIKKPVIIFGDHTRCFKFVDFDFVAGADGIHILEPKDFFYEKLFYYFCLALDFPNKGYSRHFQYLAKTTMKIPPLEIQKRIVARLESAFEKIEKGSAHLQDARTKLAKYKQSLLKSAFNGTLTATASLQGVEKAQTIHTAASLRASVESVAIHTKALDCHDLTSSKLAMTDKENPKLPQGWTIKTLGEVLNYEQPTKYIVKSTKYNDSYKTPVLTAGKSFILGYTDELEGIFTQIPVIIFDDFTTDTKFVDFKFKVKSSAMKILHSKENADIKFIYYFMQTIRHISDTHKRYWISEYAKIKIPLPPLEIQKQIVKLLEKHLQHADKTGEFIESALNKAKQLKQSLLKSAFAGELV